MADNKTKIRASQARQFLHSPRANSWHALRAAREKAAREGDRFRFSSDLVEFYNQVRTEFEHEG